jgi:hypothetical protein
MQVYKQHGGYVYKRRLSMDNLDALADLLDLDIKAGKHRRRKE